MLKNALIFAACAFLCYLISEYRVWLDFDRVIYNKYPGKCKTILERDGSEDFVELDDDTILVSSELHTYGIPGSIYALYNNGTLQKAKLLNINKDDHPLISPHGLSIWKDPKTGSILLYVVIHKTDSEGVAVFKVEKGPVTLTFMKIITDQSFNGFTNDLAVVDKDKFYITQSVRWRSLITWIIECALYLPTGNIIYYDGTKGRVVKSGLRMTNGVALSNDKRNLYVAETLTKSIHSLAIQPNGEVKTSWVHNIGTGPDNLNVDTKTGDIWVGACPSLVTVVDLLAVFGYQPVGQVIRLKIKNKNVTGVEEVFSDDGRLLSGSSVAIYRNKKLFIGTIKAQLVMCDVHYLND